MHGGLRCQTDETPDAREVYAAVADVEACDDCLIVAATRGAAAPVLDSDDERPGEITWLVQAMLAGQGGADDVRRKPPLASPAVARKRQQG